MVFSGAGSNNTAFGQQSPYLPNAGTDDVAVGFGAALYNQGSRNVTLGSGAMSVGLSEITNTYVFATGPGNIAIGYQTSSAIQSNTSYTTAVGYRALYNNSAGSLNTETGYQALETVSTGTSNIALGTTAGTLITTNSNNVEIGKTGVSSDSGSIRIGTSGTQTASYIAGVSGTTVTGAAVLINSSGQLGVQSSSARYKEQDQDMGNASNALMKLRPSEFRYKQAGADGIKRLQFGLVAEEVARVYPELVVRGKDGQVDTVQYHQLPAMLLNEIQKQQRTIDDQQRNIAGQGQEIEDLRTEMQSIREMIRARKRLEWERQ